jgi:hypothetical protein
VIFRAAGYRLLIAGLSSGGNSRQCQTLGDNNLHEYFRRNFVMETKKISVSVKCIIVICSILLILAMQRC